ncbi:GspH/FimT family pseudopilin [Zobellella iuensis]|uniref:Type II secretion system protein H n=1 Tax=Zobellella iuensis TaxID=2803811 RepID=A0ABS1QPR1_9GAMM|nr:GspH/FimT family pseudopilin [Zobellella iuensis]MBL1376849.1 GspH/FimT family pseudopilin [Zobellella iuensis]
MTRGHAGLTLVELLVGMAVLAVLLVIAVPSFQTLRQQYLVRSAGMVVYSDLQLARSESIKRNRAVTVCFTGLGSTNWSYQLRDSADCTGTVLESVNGQGFPAITLTASYGGGLLTFRPRRNTLTAGNVTLSHGSHGIKVMTWNNSIIRTCSDDSLIGVPRC